MSNHEKKCNKRYIYISSYCMDENIDCLSVEISRGGFPLTGESAGKQGRYTYFYDESDEGITYLEVVNLKEALKDDFEGIPDCGVLSFQDRHKGYDFIDKDIKYILKEIINDYI